MLRGLSDVIIFLLYIQYAYIPDILSDIIFLFIANKQLYFLKLMSDNLLTCTGVARINIKRFSRDRPGYTIICGPCSPWGMGAGVVMLSVMLVLLWLWSSLFIPSMKYIIKIMDGAPKINERRKDVLHLKTYHILSLVNFCKFLAHVASKKRRKICTSRWKTQSYIYKI